MKRFARFDEIPFVWSQHLPPGRIVPDPDGTRWIVGVGTDLQELIFKANLTTRDLDFLESLGIEVD